MKTMIEELRGGSILATLASGPFGSRIAFAPEGEGNGGEGEGDGDNSDGEAGEGGTPPGTAEAGTKEGSKLNGLGMFGARDGKKQDAEANEDGDGEADPGDDAGGDKKPPEGVPAKFWDAEKGEVKLDALSKAYSDLEKAHGQLKRSKGIGGDVPDDPADYFKEGFSLPEEVDRLKIEGPDDPGLQAWGKIAKKYGIGKEGAVAIAKDMFAELNPFAPEPVNPEAERKKLGKNANGVIDGVYTWLEGHEAEGVFSERDIEIVGSLAATADGISLLSKFRSLTGAQPIPLTSSEGKQMSAQAWHQQYQKAINESNYAKQEELEGIRDRLWPDGIPRAANPDK